MTQAFIRPVDEATVGVDVTADASWNDFVALYAVRPTNGKADVLSLSI